jgi:hypothetical protein
MPQPTPIKGEIPCPMHVLKDTYNCITILLKIWTITC